MNLEGSKSPSLQVLDLLVNVAKEGNSHFRQSSVSNPDLHITLLPRLCRQLPVHGMLPQPGLQQFACEGLGIGAVLALRWFGPNNRSHVVCQPSTKHKPDERRNKESAARSRLLEGQIVHSMSRIRPQKSPRTIPSALKGSPKLKRRSSPGTLRWRRRTPAPAKTQYSINTYLLSWPSSSPASGLMFIVSENVVTNLGKAINPRHVQHRRGGLQLLQRRLYRREGLGQSQAAAAQARPQGLEQGTPLARPQASRLARLTTKP